MTTVTSKTAGLPELLARRRLQTLADSRYLLSEFDFGERADEMDRLLRSIERFGYADDSNEGNKLKYALTSILYYIFIFTAVAYAFLALWVSGVFSI